jgi:hypothetical protein
MRFNRIIDLYLANHWRAVLAALSLLFVASDLWAQDTEPRRWAQMPTGLNFIGIGTNYTQGDIFLDPVILAEDVTFEAAGVGLAYIRSFGMFGKSARVDVSAPYASGRWEGFVDGVYTSVRRRGFRDPRLRLSMLLYGGPAETPSEFAQSEKSNTVVGAAVSVSLPYGHYLENRLINLGQNRWIIRPQLGVTHNRNKWTYELTGSIFIYGDNDEFWSGNKLESDPLYAIQGHLIYTFRPGLWASLSAAYGSGWQSTVNGLPKDNESANWVTALSAGYPLSRTQGLKVSWIRFRSHADTGADQDSLALGWSVMF